MKIKWFSHYLLTISPEIYPGKNLLLDSKVQFKKKIGLKLGDSKGLEASFHPINLMIKLVFPQLSNEQQSQSSFSAVQPSSKKATNKKIRKTK